MKSTPNETNSSFLTSAFQHQGVPFHFNFRDKRFERTCFDILSRMESRQDVCLRKLADNRAEEVRFGAFFRNINTDRDRLIDGCCSRAGTLSKNKHVLLIQDSSEINYQSHAGRVQGLGTVGNGKDLGLFVHPVLTIDGESEACYGLSHIHLWQRHDGKADNYQQLPIEEKESYRWIDSIDQARKRLDGECTEYTVVADRESDIYEMWERLPDNQTDILVRACHDRCLETSDNSKLFEWISEQDVQAEIRVNLRAIPGSRTAHEASLQIRYGEVEIKAPKRLKKKGNNSIKLRYIEALESPETVVGDEKPIHWRLLTTHELECIDDALQCLKWYTMRWFIEQLFRILKKQGLNLESSQITTAEALEKLAVMALTVATQSLQLVQAREGKTDRPASDVFDVLEIQVLQEIQGTLEGKTEKSKCPYSQGSLAWASWIIARLGGWKGYASEKKPGPITMRNGLHRFNALYDGWMLAQESLQRTVTS